jgi:3-isopropylmalate dehydratase small subunit
VPDHWFSVAFITFAELRYAKPEEVTIMDADVAKPKLSFVLNQEGYNNGATNILIAGDSFGCGS